MKDLNLPLTTGDQLSLEWPPVYITQKIGGPYRSPNVGFIPKRFLLQLRILYNQAKNLRILFPFASTIL